jgi:CubicO group peptidase (beta-lactamase class C family)
MPRILACALLVAANCGSSALGSSSEAGSTAGGDAAIAKQLEAAIQDEVEQGFSGSVLVARDGRVLLQGVYGSLQGKALSPDGRFLIASAAKQFTSTALLKLQERGRLDLDDPISKYFPDAPEEKRVITIRQLLSHTSGLPQAYDSESSTTWQQAAKSILNTPLTAKPGQKFQYSNENYQLGVALLEAVSGRRYAEFVRTELLTPAKLRDTGQLDGPASVRKLSPTMAPLPPRLLDFRWGGFGYYSTAADFYRWYMTVRSGELLNASSDSELFAPRVKIGEGHAALGWFVGTTAGGEQRIFTRGNDDVGSSSLLYAYPQSDTVIVVLSHAGSKDEEMSWARAVHARMEALLFQTQP